MLDMLWQWNLLKKRRAASGSPDIFLTYTAQSGKMPDFSPLLFLFFFLLSPFFRFFFSFDFRRWYLLGFIAIVRRFLRLSEEIIKPAFFIKMIYINRLSCFFCYFPRICLLPFCGGEIFSAQKHALGLFLI